MLKTTVKTKVEFSSLKKRVTAACRSVSDPFLLIVGPSMAEGAVTARMRLVNGKEAGLWSLRKRLLSIVT